jgi:alpha-L-fucosidase
VTRMATLVKGSRVRCSGLFLISLCLILILPVRAFGRPLEELQQSFIDLKFGMFLHFNMATFHNIEHATGKEDPMSFNPTHLNIEQWADAAVSARMKYAVLTVRHVDGFCLWPTKTTQHSVANSSYRKDIVRDFVDTFRNKGLQVGFYYSMEGRHDGHKLELVLNQLTELLTDYGDILIIWFDAWGKHEYPSFEVYPFDTVVNHVKSLQPNCLILNNDNGRSPGPTDIRCYEHNEGRPPKGNRLPSEVCYKIQSAWFGKEGDPNHAVVSVDTIVDRLLIPLTKQNCNLLLNCAPNRKGLLDENVVVRLRQVGKRLDEVWPRR